MPKYEEQELVNRARIAYAKSGAMDQPGSGSDVTEIDGVPHVALRNTNGVLAVYQLKGEALRRLPSWPASIE